MSLSEAAPPSDAITGTGVRSWLPILITLLGLLATGVAGFTSTQGRITALETRISKVEPLADTVKDAAFRLATVETQAREDRELLRRIDRRLELLICKQDPVHCDDR
jgi:hypothetical protein